MKNIINLQKCCQNNKCIPKKSVFKKWIKKILYKQKNNIITIRVVDEDEIKKLNYIYRKKKYATNILSFPFHQPIKYNYQLLGDLVLCKKIIEKESKKYNKCLESHWAHITIHGTLHLLGYHHNNDQEEYIMKKKENEIMFSLKYLKPNIF